ncbi:TIR domain-containing protein [Peribacillus butanolivorans]|uniref:TIR domain-containing protein n=1 Tax=Peribacillus butanolivorans TaxID=421767 RepID=UPI00364BB8B6
MYYHVLIRAKVGKESEDMLEMDIKNKAKVLQDVVFPYLADEEFMFDGYFIQRKNIERIVIKLSEQSAKDSAAYESKQNIQSNLFMHISPQDIFNYDEYTVDITKELFFEAKKVNIRKETTATENFKGIIDRTKVFIVHGHDELAQSKVARFVERLGFETIILHEQASSSKTIIEKIEKYSNVGFGIVLYTPCDIGAKNETEPKLRTRARQNVVFEHGFLMGKIGRSNVCALIKDEVETPNDISGVVYVTMDPHDAWKNTVAKEMKEAGYDIDMNKL